MRSKKLTPLETLQKQRNTLQVKSRELTQSIENHAVYLHRNFGLLLRNSLAESAVSKMPSKLQNFAGHLLKKEKALATQDSSVLKVTQEIAVWIIEIAPFFLKGKKGVFLSVLLKQIAKWIS